MRRTGFTLLELMIVVAIIAIIASIAVPSLTNARKSANEARAISTLRTITTVQEQYRTRFGAYAPAFDHLEDARYIDIHFDAYDLLGYAGTQHTWSISVGPTTVHDGDRYFYADQTGVIRFSSTGAATAADPPVE